MKGTGCPLVLVLRGQSLRQRAATNPNLLIDPTTISIHSFLEDLWPHAQSGTTNAIQSRSGKEQTGDRDPLLRGSLRPMGLEVPIARPISRPFFIGPSRNSIIQFRKGKIMPFGTAASNWTRFLANPDNSGRSRVYALSRAQ